MEDNEYIVKPKKTTALLDTGSEAVIFLNPNQRWKVSKSQNGKFMVDYEVVTLVLDVEKFTYMFEKVGE